MKRIKLWRVAQAVYMPQTLAYESDSLSPDDDFDDAKPETWQLFLPSAVPEGDRASCYKGIIETERELRLAQLQDNLVALKTFRRALRNLRLYFKTNTAGEGQKIQTKSRSTEAGVTNRIKRVVWRYRVAHQALLRLDPTGDWTKEYRELKDEDNRGPLKETEERGTGDGRYNPSWIWTAHSSMMLPGEGSVAEQQEVNNTARYEWMTCRARADRWMEEEELLQEEMRRVVVFLEWKARWWSDKVGTRAGSCPPDIQNGVDAYARKQANVYHEIAVSFASQWLPYLKAFRLDTQWAKDLPWSSRILAHKTELPKQFSVALADNPPVPPSPSAQEQTTEHPVTCEVQGEGSGSKEGGGSSEYSDGERCDEGERDFDGEEERGFGGEGEWDSDDEEARNSDYEGQYSHGDDASDEDRGSDDGVESGDEFGFEYDDTYMC